MNRRGKNVIQGQRWAMAGCLLSLVLTGCAGRDVAAPQTCQVGESMQQTALYFGRNIGDSGRVTQAQWQQFVNNEITPRFPRGLTILDAAGQWRSQNQTLVHEPSKVLLLMYKPGADVERRIEAVRTQYKQQFAQESVLRVDQPVCVNF